VEAAAARTPGLAEGIDVFPQPSGGVTKRPSKGRGRTLTEDSSIAGRQLAAERIVRSDLAIHLCFYASPGQVVLNSHDIGPQRPRYSVGSFLVSGFLKAVDQAVTEASDE
jgi:hypothetical protein